MKKSILIIDVQNKNHSEILELRKKIQELFGECPIYCGFSNNAFKDKDKKLVPLEKGLEIGLRRISVNYAFDLIIAEIESSTGDACDTIIKDSGNVCLIKSNNCEFTVKLITDKFRKIDNFTDDLVVVKNTLNNLNNFLYYNGTSAKKLSKLEIQ